MNIIVERNMSAPDLISVPKPKTMSTSQQELIEIMSKVKQGEYSQSEAEYLFFDWQHRHRRADETSSFKDKQVNSESVVECKQCNHYCKTCYFSGRLILCSDKQ